jgi:hypothetical protein
MTHMYEKGIYHARIEDQDFEVSSSTGSARFVLKLGLLGRYNAQDDLEPCPQLQRTYRQTLNEIGVRILSADLRAMGVEVNDLTQLHPGLDGHISLVGKEVDVTCHHEPYQGRMVERWTIGRRRLNLGALQALQGQFGHLLSAGTVAGAQPQSNGEGEAA